MSRLDLIGEIFMDVFQFVKNLSIVLVSHEMKDLRKTAQRDLALETMEELNVRSKREVAIDNDTKIRG